MKVIRQAVKRWGRPIVCTGAYYSGYCKLTERLGVGQGARILSYHGIEDQPSNAFAVSTETFARHMALVSERFDAVGMDELVRRLVERDARLPRTIAVTIDDGYLDSYTRAFPIFKEHSMPATIFLPVAYIDGTAAADPTNRMAQGDFVSWDQVREMWDEGIEFGSHTMSHQSLGMLSDEQVTRELKDSKQRLEEELGQTVIGLAYPYGTVRDYNSRIAELVADAGYTWAVTLLSGVNQDANHLRTLRRTKVELHDSLAVFEKMLHGALDPWVVVDRLGILVPRRRK